MFFITMMQLEQALQEDENFAICRWTRFQNGFETFLPLLTSEGVHKVRIWVDLEDGCVIQGFDLANTMIFEQGGFFLNDALDILERLIYPESLPNLPGFEFL